MTLNNVDQAIISRLANIKGGYEHALLLLENPTPLEGAIALVLMDNVLEASFKLVLDKTELKVKRGVYFPTLLDKVLQIKELNELKNYKLALLVLHRARNGFQHDGIIPDLNTVLREYKPLTEHILKSISKQKLGYRWEEISLSLLIRDKTINKLYRKAEDSFQKGDYVTATAYLIYTFEVVKSIARMYIFGSGLSSSRDNMKKRYKDHIVRYLTTLDEEVEAFKLGLNYLDLRNYLDVASCTGINSILYAIPYNTKEEMVINEFKQKLEKTIEDTDLLKKWCVNIRDPILKFIIRTEANWRTSLEVLNKLVKAVIEGLSKVFEKSSKDELKNIINKLE